MAAHRVCCLGPSGSWSALAAEKFCPESEIVLCRTFSVCCEVLLRGDADAAVFPIENSIHGGVLANLDLFERNPRLFAERELILPIDHRLARREGVPISRITRIFSHEQAIGQCSEYLRRCFPDAQIVYTESTAESLSRLDEHSAGIVGAHLHAEGVVLSEENIADEKNNVTHFLLAVADGTPHPPTEKIFLCARLRHRAGSLLSFLKIFARYDLNLTKIESRPVRDCVGEYNFFIEFEGDFGEERVKSALTEAREHCVRFRVLGAY